MAARKPTNAVVAQSAAPIIPAQPFALKAGVAVGEAAVASARSATLFGKAAAISFAGARKVSAQQDEALLSDLRSKYGL